MGWHRGEGGVSEVVATILLVGVTVILVAIVATIFLSAPQPAEIPHAAIVAKNESGRFALSHKGGDPLRDGEYRVYIDTGSGLVDETGNFSSPDGSIWGVGENITYNGTWSSSDRVVVTVVSGGVDTILTEVNFRGGGKVFDPDPVKPEEPEGPEPIEVIIEENIFVYGTTLKFDGDAVNGPGATIVITGGLNTADVGYYAPIAVSNIYIDGDVELNGGSAGLGSVDKPGAIYISGSLKILEGNRSIYGDVYVAGDCHLKGVNLYGNASINGDLTLGEGNTFGNNIHINYTGEFVHPDSMDQETLNKFNHQATVPKFDMLDLEMPSVKSAGWYEEKGYATGPVVPALTDNVKIFASSYSSSGSATNVIIIAYDGNISITGWGNEVTGVFFAPKGNVTFNGNSLEGVVIARDGLFVTSGGTKVTFKNIGEYITDPEDYPF